MVGRIYDLADIERDVIKIREWFRFIDIGPWGMVCAFADTNAVEWLKIIKDRTENAGDKLVQGRVARPLGTSMNLQTYARILTNKMYKGPGT